MEGIMVKTVGTGVVRGEGIECLFCKRPIEESHAAGDIVELSKDAPGFHTGRRIEYAHPECWTGALDK